MSKPVYSPSTFLEFEQFLAEAYEVIVIPCKSEWELLRFNTPRGLHGIVYRNHKNQMTFVGAAKTFWEEFNSLSSSSFFPANLQQEVYNDFAENI